MFTLDSDHSRGLSSLSLCIAALALGWGSVVQAQNLQIGRTLEQSSNVSGSTLQTSSEDAAVRAVRQAWGLTTEEYVRFQALDKGFRGFFAQNLSPLEILGIHARNEAERKQYAERFARIQYEDVSRILAFDRARQEAFTRLYPKAQLINYGNQPRVTASVGAADAFNVPRRLIYERPAPLLPKQAAAGTNSAAKPAVNSTAKGK